MFGLRNSFLYGEYLGLMQKFPSARERAKISPILYAQYHIITPLIKKFAHGRCIDLGCGNAPFSEILEKYTQEYNTVDIEKKFKFLTFQANIENLHEIVLSETYDFAVCLEVLEHLPHPWKAISEIQRILKSGGILILSVPHLSRLHEVPHDYYRFTEFGLRSLLLENGFSIISVIKRGGLFSFLVHQWLLFLNMILWRVPILNSISLFVSQIISFSIWKIDNIIKLTCYFPAGYIVVARKK